MSRIGRKNIIIPSGVTVNITGDDVVVKGPKGELTYTTRPEISVAVEGDQVVCKVVQDTKGVGSYWGLTRALIANMVKGVTEGFQRELELVGVGYRAKSDSPNKISLSVGYSNPVEFEAPEGISLEVEDQKKIKITGIDKNIVGLTAARIRKIRKPEPYKGKGIKYVDEVVRRKAGKTGKA